MSFKNLTRVFIALLMFQSLLSIISEYSLATDISWNGDTVISDSRTSIGDKITLTGNLTITGSLTLIGTELVVNCLSCGTYAIDITNGGALNILAGSSVHASNPDAHYLFRVWPGSALTINDSAIRDCGFRYNNTTPITDRGLYLNSSSVSITNSTITQNNVGIIIDNATSPFIYRNNISWNDDSAIFIRAGSVPMIDHNVICSNMMHAWNNFTGAIHSESSSPVIINNSISDNNVLGIELAVSGNPIIRYNNISGHKKQNSNQAAGIWNQDNNADILGNNLSGNNNGISLRSGSSRVIGNILNNNIGESTINGDGYGILDSSLSVLGNNSYYGNTYGIGIQGPSTSLYENETIRSSSRAGVEEYFSSKSFSVSMSNCSFSGNGLDVQLQTFFSGSGGGYLDLINPTIENIRVSVTDLAASLKVSWYLKSQVVYENGSRPVQGASVNVTDLSGARAASLITGSVGWTERILLEAYTNTGGMSSIKTPFNISAAKDARSNYTADIALTSSRNATIILDDIPPSVEIISPVNGTLTNRPGILVMGRTERKVSLQVNGNQVAIGPDGIWSIDVPLPKEEANEIRAEVMDGGNNRGIDAIMVFRDTIAPGLNITSPKDGLLTNHSDVMVTGTVSDPAASLTVHGENVIIGPDGGFSLLYALAEGTNTITFECHDAAGNKASSTRTVEKDSIPPMLMLLKPTDGFATTQDSVDIVGSADTDCSLTINSRPLALDNGQFSIQAGLVEGENQFELIARDKAGNENRSLLTVIKDSTPPTITILSPIDGELLNYSMVKIQGTTEAGAILRINGNLVTLDGTNFSVMLSLMEGQNIIDFEAIDSLENTARNTISVDVDTISPILNIKSPTNRTLTNYIAIEFQGTTETGAVVTINGDDVMVNHNGTFIFTANLTKEGPNLISVVSRDSVWNIAEKILTIYRDTILNYNITSPQNNITVKAENITISGNVEPGATVVIGNLTVALNSDGTFSQNVLLGYGLNRITVSIKDKAGNSALETLNVTRVLSSTEPQAKRFIPGFNITLMLMVISLSLLTITRRKHHEGK
jgi:parallel beta-helix repeat protein